MRNFFLFSVIYLAFAAAVVSVFREDPAMQFATAVVRSLNLLITFTKYLPYIAAALLIVFALTRRLGGKGMLTQSVYAFLGCFLFSVAFMFTKTTIPYVVPFYADPFFADLDKAMHFGTDPWVWTHKFADWIPADAVSTVYFVLWGLPAAFFPLIIALSDHDEDRKRRFIILHCMVWVGLGNILALIGSSVGPVYYDRLLGTERFPELLEALVASGITETRVGLVQENLWDLFVNHSQSIGAGISAFPSVHNGVATMAMLYMIERSRWLAPVGVGFCLSILFLSVYIGWHYAIDGYVSIALVTLVWYLQRVSAARRRRNVAFASYKPA